MRVVLFHNTACSNSRGVLAILRDAGIEPDIIDYLQAPPTRAALARLIHDAGLRPRDVVRRKEAVFATLGLGDASVDDALLDAMAEHPVLIQRPFVVTPLGTRLCRPPERVRELLPG